MRIIKSPKVKPPWYNKNHLCDFHKIKGHTMASCMRLKNLIQDLIDDKIINVEQPIGNQDLKIYTNPIPDHNKGNNHGKKKYGNVNHVYDHVVESLDEWVTIVNIKRAKADCGVTTRGGKVTIVGPSQPSKAPTSNRKSFPNSYNVLDQLKKTPAQISIMELLKISPTHKKILEEALASYTIPTDLDADQFQAMVEHISTPIVLDNDFDIKDVRNGGCLCLKSGG